MDVNAMRPAGFWIRFLAHIVDGLVLLVPNCMLMALIGNNEHAGAVMLANTLVAIAYVVGFLSSPWAATPGKRLLKIYVVRAQGGQRISQARALARYLVLNGPGLLMLIPLTLLNPQHALLQPLAPEDQRELTLLQDKKEHSETLSAEEMQHYTDLNYLMMINPDDLSPEDQAEYKPLHEKLEKRGALTSEDNARLGQMMVKHLFSGKSVSFMAFGLLSCIYSLVVAFTIGLTAHKTGIHDMICATRAVRGRPDEPAPAPAV